MMETLQLSSELTTITNLAGGETLSFTGSGSVSSANVQTGQSITNGTLAINNGTGLASNYNLTTGTFDITQRWVTLSGTRNYDGTTTANSSVLTISNLVSGETWIGNGTVAGTSTILDSDLNSSTFKKINIVMVG